MLLHLIHPWAIVLWIALSWLIGMLGANKRFGFFGNFLVSLLFSPLVGVIVLLASDQRPTPRPTKRR